MTASEAPTGVTITITPGWVTAARVGQLDRAPGPWYAEAGVICSSSQARAIDDGSGVLVTDSQ